MNRSYIEKEDARRRAFDTIWSNEIDAVFADVAHYYDRANVYATLGLLTPLRRSFVSTIDVYPGERVLDVCAGTNVIGIDLLKREPTLEVHAIDRSRAMQEVGSQVAKQQGLHIRSYIGRAGVLPLPHRLRRDDFMGFPQQGSGAALPALLRRRDPAFLFDR